VGLGYILISQLGNERDGQVIVRPGRERGVEEGVSQTADLPVTLRIHGRDSAIWRGRIDRLPESEAREIPALLASRYGGPVAVKAGSRNDAMVPQAQQYLVFIDVLDPDAGISAGMLAQAKIHCRPETCARWLWRTLNNLFDLGLM
jgi:putative peptide zinc metalloprotease protein